MSESDLGNYIMKLFDPLITESRSALESARDEFVQSIPRKVPAHSSVPIYQTENFVKDGSDILIKISQDLLTQYSISIAKKARSSVKKISQGSMDSLEETKQQLLKKEEEVDGLQKKVSALEKRANTLEAEKEETLRQFSQMNATVDKLQSDLSSITARYENQIREMTASWEEKFRQNQEEWESYVKLKIAEKEIESAKKQQEEE